MKRIQIYKILFLIAFWEFCLILQVVYDASLFGFEPQEDGIDYSFSRNLVSGIGITFIGAFFLALVEVNVLGRILRKNAFGISILIKTLVYLGFMLFFISAGVLWTVSMEYNKSVFSQDVLNFYYEFVLKGRFITSILYWGLACGAGLFILQVNDKYGQGVLFNFIRGKYHSPKVENRFFMFMDLKSSTSFAESLGHIKYSRLIQECYYDLTETVISHNAEIYQYVGDEVVLSWAFEKGIENENCIKAYYAYEAKLRSRCSFYKDTFDVMPEFKASLNIGEVTVAEVGEIKKELAYHGDVLNTAARIQGKCNEFKSRLLVSKQVADLFLKSSLIQFKFLGNIPLKGKINNVDIYSVSLVNEKE